MGDDLKVAGEPEWPSSCPHGFDHAQTLADRLTWPKQDLSVPDIEDLRHVAILYANVCRREIPTLARNEWLLILDALLNTWLVSEGPDGGLNVVTSATATIANAIAVEQLDVKWDVDARVLRSKLAVYSYATFIAMLDMVRRIKTYCDDDRHTDNLINEAVALGELYAQRPELRRAGGYPEVVFSGATTSRGESGT